MVTWWREALARRRLRRQPVMKPYVNLGARWRTLALIATPITVGLFCLLYGFFFALTAPYMIVAFVAPIAALVLLSIWALPDRPNAPTKTMELFFSAALICLVLWPNYLALVLPGLPWITATRLTGTPMALLMLVSLSSSKTFRSEVTEVIKTVPNLWLWFLAFIAIQLVTIVFSKSPGGAISKWIIQQQNWVAITVVAAWICRIPGRSERYILAIMLMAVPILAVAVKEYDQNGLLWLGHIPSFLKIEDPAVASVVYSTITRGATGQYRAKAVFSTPLGLAEYVALLTPFAIHFAVSNYHLALRVFGFLLVPFIFYGARMTDARLGVMGFLVSVFLYVLIWGMIRFRRNRRDLLAATVVYAYPGVLLAAGLLVTSVQSINVLVFGSGAQVASNQARAHQLVMGIPKVLANPIGHGGGGAGSAMGYGEGSFIAIDNYYLVIGLDYGVIGLVTFLGIFLLTIGWSIRSALTLGGMAHDRELSLLVPIAVCMSAFLVIKAVFAQAELHPMMFMMVGMASALIYRARSLVESRLSVASATPASTGRQAECPAIPAEDDAGLSDDFDDDQPLARAPMRRKPPLLT